MKTLYTVHIETPGGGRFSYHYSEEEVRVELVTYFNEVHAEKGLSVGDDDPFAPLHEDADLEAAIEKVEECENVSIDETAVTDVWVLVTDHHSSGTSINQFTSRRAALDDLANTYLPAKPANMSDDDLSEAIVSAIGSRRGKFVLVRSRKQGTPIMRYFVHIYHVVRSKILVEADDERAAIAKAEDMLPDIMHRIGYQMLPGTFDQDAMAAGFDDMTLPIHFQTEGAEVVTGYLVDTVGDEDYENSKAYNADGELEAGDSQRMLVSPKERDTILAALKLWRDTGGESANSLLMEIALNGRDSALDSAGIDALCERMNL